MKHPAIRSAVLAATLVATLAMPATGAVQGRTLHLATNGSDAGGCSSGGTAGSPWRTFDHALRCLRPGDTLVVRPGTYRERVARNAGGRAWEVHAGTASAPILVTAAPGADVRIEGLLRLEGIDHWTINGIDVTNDGQPYGSGDYLVKLRGGEQWTFANGHVWNATSYAAFRVERDVAGQPARDFRIVGSCIHGTAATHPPYQDHNLYIVTGAGGGGLIERNVVFGAPNGQNIKLGGDAIAQDVVIRDNTLHGGAQNILMTGGTRGTVIEGNLMTGVHGKDWYPNVRGFALTGGGNRVVGNAAADARTVVLTGSDGGQSTTSIAASGNLVRAPGYDRVGTCSGFTPTDAATARYGAKAPQKRARGALDAFVGDWDGDGVETPGWYDRDTATFHLTNEHRTGHAEIVLRYGVAGDVPVVGDWDGDGVTSIGIRRGNRWFLSNRLASGHADYDFRYGYASDTPITGDWDGDGKDTPAIIRGNHWHLSNSKEGGWADVNFRYGYATDVFIYGDWDGDGLDTPGVIRGNRWFMVNGQQGGFADYVFRYGLVDDAVATGDWNGDGRQTPAVIRGYDWFLSDNVQGGNASSAFTLAP